MDDDGVSLLPRDATRPLELVDALVAWVIPQHVSELVKAVDRCQRLPDRRLLTYRIERLLTYLLTYRVED